MSDEDRYTVKIEGLGLSLEREVSRQIGDQVVVLMLTGTTGPTAAISPNRDRPRAAAHAAPAGQVHPAHPDPATSVREYLDETGAKRIPDKITAIGLYLKEHSQQAEFTRDDVVTGFEGAAESVPKNLNRDIKWTLKAGWIAEKTGKKGQYYVTKSGKTAVEQSFPKELVKKTQGLMPGGKRPSGVTDE